MKNVIKYLIILFITGILASIKPGYSQSAIGQLENISGQKINSSSSSTANFNNAVSGAIIGSLLNSLFSSSPAPSQADIEAKQKSDLEAQQRAAELAAEQQRIKEQEAQAAHDKMMGSYKLLDDSQTIRTKTLDNKSLTFKGLDDVNKAVPIMRSQNEANAEEYFRTHFSPISPNNDLDAGNFKYEAAPFFTKELLQKEQHLIIVGAGLVAAATTGGTVAAVISWGTPVLEEGIINPLENCLSGDCPSRSEVLKNVLFGEENNLKTPIGEKVSEKMGTIVATKAGVDPAKYARLGSKSFNTIFNAADAGNEIWGNGGREIWGSITGKDAAEAARKADLMRNMKY
jgi:hypothetical protein